MSSKFSYSKANFISFVKKYYLNGKAESAIIECKNGGLYTNFKDMSGDIRGIITMKDYDIGACEMGVYRTGHMLNLFSLPENDIKISLARSKVNDNVIVSMEIEDAKNTASLYRMQNPDIIERNDKIGARDNFDVEIKLNVESIDKIIKANHTIPENKTITFERLGDKLLVFFGFGYINKNENVARIQLETEKLEDRFGSMSFSSEGLKSILVANSDKFIEATIGISSTGEMRIYFAVSDNLTAEYWIKKYEAN